MICRVQGLLRTWRQLLPSEEVPVLGGVSQVGSWLGLLPAELFLVGRFLGGHARRLLSRAGVGGVATGADLADALIVVLSGG